MFWLVFIFCEYTDHVVCECGTLHPLEDCWSADDEDWEIDWLFSEHVLTFGDCEIFDVPTLRSWPVPERWSNGDWMLKKELN